MWTRLLHQQKWLARQWHREQKMHESAFCMYYNTPGCFCDDNCWYIYIYLLGKTRLNRWKRCSTTLLFRQTHLMSCVRFVLCLLSSVPNAKYLVFIIIFNYFFSTFPILESSRKRQNSSRSEKLERIRKSNSQRRCKWCKIIFIFTALMCLAFHCWSPQSALLTLTKWRYLWADTTSLSLFCEIFSGISNIQLKYWKLNHVVAGDELVHFWHIVHIRSISRSFFWVGKRYRCSVSYMSSSDWATFILMEGTAYYLFQSFL